MLNKIERIKRKRNGPKTIWMDGIEGDLKRPGVIIWRRMVLGRNNWMKFLKQTKTRPGL